MNVIISPSALSGTVAAPPSKSCAHRALICASLAKGKSTVMMNGVSDDVKATVECLRALGAKISINDGAIGVEPIAVPAKKAFLPCGESGSTLRFLLPVVFALGVEAEFGMAGRLPQRPLEALLKELRRHGAVISDSPLKISGKPGNTDFVIDGSVSSQFASGLLFACCVNGGSVTVIPPVCSEGYIDMTVGMLRRFGIDICKKENKYTVSGGLKGKEIAVEGDWSNSLFWLAAGVNVSGLDESSAQRDKRACEIIKNLDSIEYIDASDIPDAVPVIAAAASTAKGRTVITGAACLRDKESDRLSALTNILGTLGADITETGDGLVICGKPFLNGGKVDSFSDHRMVFAAVLAALKCENNVTITNAECVSKSYPGFFEEFEKAGGNVHVL